MSTRKLNVSPGSKPVNVYSTTLLRPPPLTLLSGLVWLNVIGPASMTDASKFLLESPMLQLSPVMRIVGSESLRRVTTGWLKLLFSVNVNARFGSGGGGAGVPAAAGTTSDCTTGGAQRATL